MLYETLSRHVVQRSTWFNQVENTYDNMPLFRILFVIYYLPFTWRKWILDACRIQEDMTRNDHLKLFIALGDYAYTFLHRNRSYTITKQEIAMYFSNIYDSPIACCLLSYFVRAEGSFHLDQAQKIREESINKETSAAILYTPGDQQVLDYSWIGQTFHPNRAYALYNNGLALIRRKLSRHDSVLFLPYYNDGKNVGQRTAAAFLQLTGQESPITGVTTLDLLKYYHQTGMKIPGPMEVRVKWGTNDLKPRVYYALGGDAYFAGLYVQRIANLLCDILPSTNPHSRFDTTRLRALSNEEILVTYDYTSFTTSLTELKYFIHYLSVFLRGVEMDILDVHFGVTSLDLGEYLEEYNRSCNWHQRIDLGRIFDDLAGVDIYQGRNGSLGTQGNITFSTSHHGVNLSSFTNTPHEDSCVGDDALTIILRSFLPAFINHVVQLGHINPEKFTTFEKPPFDDPTLSNRQQYKYLKRPITVDFVGKISTGLLDAFPNVAEALSLSGDGFHDVPDPFSPALLKNFCMQWGRFLTRQRMEEIGLSYATTEELMFIIELVGYVYHRFRIPIEGLLPGQRYWNPDLQVYEEAYFFAPPCDDLTVFSEDWAELLYTRFHGEEVAWPVYTSEVVTPEERVTPGMTFRASQGHPLVKIMVALGYFESRMIVIRRPFDEHMYSEMKSGIDGDFGSRNALADIEVLLECPEWYLDVYVYYLHEKHVGDPLEAWSDVDTVFS